MSWKAGKLWLVPNGPAGGKTLELVRVSHCCQQWWTRSLTTCMSQCTLHKSAGDRKLEVVAEIPHGSVTVQRDLVRLERCAERNLKKFNRRNLHPSPVSCQNFSCVFWQKSTDTYQNTLLDITFRGVHSTCKSGTITINTKRRKYIIY